MYSLFQEISSISNFFNTNKLKLNIMNSNKYNQTTTQTTTNLIGEARHRHFLKLQAAYGFAQRGGVSFPYASQEHSKRLVSSVNILTSTENKNLVFSESIFSN